MAIAYKSQGAGVATETSGAALSPLCPATVDAGDILVAHVYWEGTTTAPSTPADWTLLSGPHVIETSIARHWVFGKVAAGTEDGAAVAFGSPAVTTQRGARVYSFSGRVAGTITELVRGFAATSHANDPQGPTVATTQAGALAVALVGQNDNNSIDSFTGESGGDWTEAVAEFVAVLAPGLLLAIQTCTPTANPGTVSGGTFNTANDPVGVVGFEIRASAPQTVDAGVGALDLTGFSPTVTVTSHQTATPGVGAIDLTGLAPTVTASNHQVITPGVGALDLAGIAPSVQIGVQATPGVGALDLTGFAPTGAVSDHQVATPGVGAIDMTGFAPTVNIGVVAAPGTGAIDLAGFAPVVSVSNHQSVFPGVGVLEITGSAPTVEAYSPSPATPPPSTPPPAPPIVISFGRPSVRSSGPRKRKVRRRVSPAAVLAVLLGDLDPLERP